MNTEEIFTKHNVKRSFRQDNTYYSLGESKFIVLKWEGESKFYDYSSISFTGNSSGNAFIEITDPSRIDEATIQTPDETYILRDSNENDLETFLKDLSFKIDKS